MVAIFIGKRNVTVTQKMSDFVILFFRKSSISTMRMKRRGMYTNTKEGGLEISILLPFEDNERENLG